MKKLFLFLLLFLVSPVYAQNATTFCTRMSTRVNVHSYLGTPKYITQYSRQEFLKKADLPPSPYTLGLTVAKLDIQAQAKPTFTQQDGQICIEIGEIDVEMTYPQLTIYIDKKYPPSSCEYQIIKDHENYHVHVAQQALSFFKKDVEKTITTSLDKLSPKIVSNQNEIKQAFNQLIQPILTDLKRLATHINKKLAEKNAAIDTKEMYQETTARCRNW